MLDLLPDGIAVFDPQLRLRFANRVFRERLPTVVSGNSAPAVDGSAPEPASLPASLSTALQRVQGGVPAASALVEQPQPGESSRLIELLVRLFPLGGQRGAMVQARDVTAKIRSERAQRESESLLGAILETCGVGLCMCDHRGRHVTVNRAYCDLFGYRPEELVGRHYTKVLPPEEFEHGQSIFDSYMGGQAPAVVATELRGRRKDGTVLYVELSARVLIREDGRRFLVASMTDITDRKEHTTQLAERADDAQREAQTKSELLLALQERLDLIQRQHHQILDLSAPILDIWEGVLAMPLIGSIDHSRASTITERLLQAVVQHRAKLVLIDLTSVEELDQAGADCVCRLIRALRLLGTRALLTGLRPQVALRLSELALDLRELESLRSLKDGLRRCLGWG
ncbi:MAG TPA: PAS domain S-box protein [Pseudomonadota bacterium]|nr:PAS domain S-box protein [Pseudomonadota bacterium]